MMFAQQLLKKGSCAGATSTISLLDRNVFKVHVVQKKKNVFYLSSFITFQSNQLMKYTIHSHSHCPLRSHDALLSGAFSPSRAQLNDPLSHGTAPSPQRN